MSLLFKMLHVTCYEAPTWRHVLQSYLVISSVLRAATFTSPPLWLLMSVVIMGHYLSQALTALPNIISHGQESCASCFLMVGHDGGLIEFICDQDASHLF